MKAKRCNDSCPCRSDPNPYCHEHKQFYMFTNRADRASYERGIIAYCRACYARKQRRYAE